MFLRIQTKNTSLALRIYDSDLPHNKLSKSAIVVKVLFHCSVRPTWICVLPWFYQNEHTFTNATFFQKHPLRRRFNLQNPHETKKQTQRKSIYDGHVSECNFNTRKKTGTSFQIQIHFFNWNNWISPVIYFISIPYFCQIHPTLFRFHIFAI